MSEQSRPDAGLSLTDPRLTVQGANPVIPDQGVDAAPSELVDAVVVADSERCLDKTLSDPLEGGVPDNRLSAPLEEFSPARATRRGHFRCR
jgi:hypothetical protein